MQIPTFAGDWATDTDGMDAHADLLDAYRGPVIATPPARDYFTINPDSTGSDLEVTLRPYESIFIKMFTDDNSGACTDTAMWNIAAFFTLEGFSDFISETDEDWDYSCRYIFSVDWIGESSKPHENGIQY